MPTVRPQYFIRLRIVSEKPNRRNPFYWVGPFNSRLEAGQEIDRATVVGVDDIDIQGMLNRTNARLQGLRPENVLPGNRIPANATDLVRLLDEYQHPEPIEA